MEVLATPKKQACQGQAAVTLPVSPDSRAITKTKPKVRIVHDMAPEIIKTDIANFRDLVQRLTGKQAILAGRRHGKIVKTPEPAVSSTDDSEKDSSACGWSKEEEEEERDVVWEGEVKSGGGFIASLEDMDVFVQSLVQYPQLPLYEQ